MKDFFSVADLPDVMAICVGLEPLDSETIPLLAAPGRVLAEAIQAETDLPPFPRSVMDGYAVRAADTFGAGESNPACLRLTGEITMGAAPDKTIAGGQAMAVATGGMLPQGADAVVMVEHAGLMDAETLEVYRSVAPGQNMVAAGEDFPEGALILPAGLRLRPQEMGLLAALGKEQVLVFRQPVIGIISTGDELVGVDQVPGPGQIRDMNTYTLAGLIQAAGAVPRVYGIVRDNAADLSAKIRLAEQQTDMVILSGGSSVGMRDLTIQAISALPDTSVLVHGIAISPGKPTILAKAGRKWIWGLPGHVVSAMIVFQVVVRPFIEQLAGLSADQRKRFDIFAILSRNLPSTQGRVDFVRVRLYRDGDRVMAEPVLGKSALVNTMVKADGLIVIERDMEGLEKGAVVNVMPI